MAQRLKSTGFYQSRRQNRVVYFPPYSPEENPQEHVWKKGRPAVTHNKFIPDILKVSSEFIAYLNASPLTNYLNLVRLHKNRAIEVFYNRQRKHSTLGYLSLVVFENRWQQQKNLRLPSVH